MRRFAAVITATGILVLLGVSWCRHDTIDPTGVATLGAASAPVVLVYYTDYQCPGCRAFATSTLPDLRRRFVDAGELRIVVKELAASREAVDVANAARCAGEFGKFWSFHDSLALTSDSAPSRATLERVAAQVGVPPQPFDQCLTRRRYADQVRSEAERSRTLGITEAPAFGIAGDGRPLYRDQILVGQLPANAIDSMVRRALAR